MSYTLNAKIKDLVPYEPISGEYNIRLDANESFLPVPEEVLAEIENAVKTTAFNRYPDPLAQKVCAQFAAYYGVDADFVTAGNGSDELISILLSAFAMRGDTILTLDPDFSMYSFYASISEAQCITIDKGESLRIDVDNLIQTANEKNAKIILFSNPCNPTSLGLEREDVRKIIRSVNALVVLDEAYMDFWDQSLLQEVSEYDNLIILRTCSKAFGMAAIRLGFAVANPTLTRAIRAVKSPYNVNSVTQEIGAAILSHGDKLKKATARIIESRKELYAKLKAIEALYPDKMKPFDSCTNFVLLRLQDAKGIFQELLQDGIAIRFMGNYVRVTAGSEEENQTFIKQFKEKCELRWGR